MEYQLVGRGWFCYISSRIAAGIGARLGISEMDGKCGGGDLPCPARHRQRGGEHCRRARVHSGGAAMCPVSCVSVDCACNLAGAGALLGTQGLRLLALPLVLCLVSTPYRISALSVRAIAAFRSELIVFPRAAGSGGVVRVPVPSQSRHWVRLYSSTSCAPPRSSSATRHMLSSSSSWFCAVSRAASPLVAVAICSKARLARSAE